MKKKISELRFYFDTFAEEVVLKKDPFACPERYFEICLSDNNTYVDTWEYDGKTIDVAFLEDDMKTKWNDITTQALAENNMPFSSLFIRRKYPKDAFLNIINRYFVIYNGQEIEVEENED